MPAPPTEPPETWVRSVDHSKELNVVGPQALILGHNSVALKLSFLGSAKFGFEASAQNTKVQNSGIAEA
ncbi:hypothetical protein MGG_15864 [Pyricularia oryzae 70-15]|uniref:Uncharacterized protein n=4 Tax=Pyricularia oryzae TaxID=318829 RepID=G4MT71_PYRO7|nr:uncharacterized protein MGG_15864 [Pyricularia oryzae 70-15]EHA55536.1 hypothetical protein MGG_15864 [Pyricularia oryzae 70-15]ELQ34294.1 hypothetical protein OOU_Y34scaffold00773g7 [Pyricularia oryzae Y34]